MAIEKTHNSSHLPHQRVPSYTYRVRNENVVNGDGQVIGSGGESMFWKTLSYETRDAIH